VIDTPIYRDTAELQAALDRRGIVVLGRPPAVAWKPCGNSLLPLYSL